MIEIFELTKVFPNPDGSEKVAVDHISLRVAPGEIYGLLGPNGAGKTTTLRMVAGLLQPTSGRVLIHGRSHGPEAHATQMAHATQTAHATPAPHASQTQYAAQVKRQIGYLTANTGLYLRLTPLEILQYFAVLYDLPADQARRRIAELIDWLDMRSFLKLRCGALSTGQKQRTNIARALIADPPVLILDEPTLGLDVLSNRLILQFIRTQADSGKAVLLSTHALDEIEKMCRRIGLMHDGRLVAEGDLASLKQRTGQSRLSDVFLALVHADEPLLAH